MNELRGKLNGLAVISQKQFTHATLGLVTEMVVQWTDDTRKLLWVRDCPDTMQIDGVDNPMAHIDFPNPKRIGGIEDKVYEEASRRRVSEAFEEHWKDKVTR